MSKDKDAPCGHMIAAAGTAQEHKIPLDDFVKAFYKDGRLISIATVRGKGVALNVENHSSSGRAPQQGMWLSEESFIALIHAAFVYYTCKGLDMADLLMRAIEHGRTDTHFQFSTNLNPPTTWNNVGIKQQDIDLLQINQPPAENE